MANDIALSIKISPAEQQRLIEALNTLMEVLEPYLIALSAEQRKQLPKMSDKTLPFVEKCLAYAQSNPQFAPVYMNIEEMKIDVEAVEILTRLSRPIRHICENIGDTTVLAGSEAYIAALAYYNSVKQAAKMNVPAAKVIYDDLSKRFPGKPRKNSKTSE